MDLTGPDILCNATNLPNFVLMVNTFRIIVLTYNRPVSLYRLLSSLENSDYSFPHNNPGWRLVLEVRVDAGGDEGHRVRKIVDKFHFSHGEKIVREEEENLGIMGVWRQAWKWRDRELFVVIEDDVEMSAHWYRAAVNMWRKYGGREYFGGLGLQFQEFRVHPPIGGVNLTARVRGPVYLYEIPSSIGTSPHPCHWARMIEMYGAEFGKCPEGMSCVKGVWEAWWLKYTLDNVLYTMYAAHKDAFAVDHKEIGYHHQKKSEALCSTVVSSWEEEREMENLPEAPDILDLHLQRTNLLGHYYMRRIWLESSIAVVRLVARQEDWVELEERLPSMSEEERKATAVVICQPDQDKEYQAKLGSVRVLYPDMFTLVRNNLTYLSSDGLLLSILTEMTAAAQKFITLPSSVRLEDLPDLQTVKTNLVAGRRPHQTHPALDFLYFDGTYNTHVTIMSLYRKYKETIEDVRLDLNFLAAYTNSRGSPHAISWSWIT